MFSKKSVKHIFIISLILFSGCSGKKASVIMTPPVGVKCAEAVSGTAVPAVTTFGTVLYYSKADVYPTTEGYIEKLHVKEGDSVNKGERLAKLRQEKLFIERDKAVSEVESKESLLKLSEEKLKEGRKEAEKKIISINGSITSLKQKELELENMKRIYNNKKELFEAGGLSPEELETVKMTYLNTEYEYTKAENDFNYIRTGYRDEDITEYGYEVPDDPEIKKELLIKINTSILEAEKQVAQAQLNSSVSELERIDLLVSETEILSPIKGIIGKRDLDIGEKVKPDTKMFTIFQSEKVFIRIEIEENRALEINKGDKAEISTDYISLTGKVEIVSPVINPETRSREMKIIALNPEGDLVPGSFVRIKIKTGEEKQEVMVPEEAVIKNEADNTYSVFIIREGRVFKKKIMIPYFFENRAVISEGLKPGELVCIDPPRNLQEGKEVLILK